MRSVKTKGKNSREKLILGINSIADAVKVTLGAAGRNVVIDHGSYKSPHITKDGVTVARSIFLEDPSMQTGVRMIKDVANTAVEASGDGTTTATVIAQAIANIGFDINNKDINPIKVVKGINIAHEWIENQLTTIAKHISYGSDDLKNIASISANNDREIGELVAEAVTMAGKHGTITVEKSDSVITSIEHVEGVKIESGWLSPYFVNNPEKRTVEYSDTLIFITNKKISLFSDMVKLIQVANSIGKPLLIIAEEVIGEALQTLIVNSMKQNIHVTAIEAPSFGNLSKEYLQDIAILTGATVVSQESGIDLNEATLDLFGTADKVVVGQLETTIINGGGDSMLINEHIALLSSLYEESPKGHIKDFTENRLAKIAGGVVILKIGAPTEIELKERRDRFDDAIGATKAAMEMGVIAGGGIPLYRLGAAFASVPDVINTDDKDILLGIITLFKAIQEPAKQILRNGGYSDDEVKSILHKVFETDMSTTYDVLKSEHGDAYKLGILDPLKVTLSALSSAVSIGGIVLTTEVLIVNED